VFTPTLTGVGERSHLLSRDVGLDTHVADVANLMIWENLRDIVLVGHSYGGVVEGPVALLLHPRGKRWRCLWRRSPLPVEAGRTNKIILNDHS
jgi:pimeloyl-ACP methyl ester carboxylesterase